MSDTELNVIELRKILEAQNLYKTGMTIIEMQEVHISLKYKQAIEAEGLYESGMSEQDIKIMYNTLKKSEQSADYDNEYRDILNRTEANCSNIDILMESPNAINDIDTVDVLVSPKPLSVLKCYSELHKKKGDRRPSIKNINVLLAEKTNHPLLKIKKVNYSNASVIPYHQKKVLKLPLKERAKMISQYLLNLNKNHKNEINNNRIWSDAIEPEPKKPFNGNLCVDFIPDASDEEHTEETCKIIEIVDPDPLKIVENDNTVKGNNVSTRPKRLVKRKNYVDQLSDDDDFAIPKKTKSNDDANSSNDNSPEAKWIKRKKKLYTGNFVLTSDKPDRISKIFDKLKWGESADSSKVSDSDDEIFPTKELITTANVHKEEDQIIKNKNLRAKTKKGAPKKRGAYNKLTIQKNSATKENESPEIPTQNFYARNKNAEVVDESNNNRLETDEDVTSCPICNRPFPLSKIEMHAANCTQYEGTEGDTYCDICNENIVDKKLPSHRYECIKKITEASIVVDKPVTRSQRNGFLCEICDAFICNMSESQHASNCIAKI